MTNHFELVKNLSYNIYKYYMCSNYLALLENCLLALNQHKNLGQMYLDQIHQKQQQYNLVVLHLFQAPKLNLVLFYKLLNYF